MEAIRQLVLRILAKSGKSGIVTTLPPKNVLDFQTMILAEKFMQNGVDPRMFKNADQAENMLKQIDEADNARASGITETESAKVFDMEGKEIPPGSKIMGGKQVKNESGSLMSVPDKKGLAGMEYELPPPGSRGGKDDIAAPVQSSEETIKNMIEAENKKNINKIKERNKNKPEPEDKAEGGRAGYKFGIGPIKKLLDFANKKSPITAYRDYLKDVKTKTLKANETGKFTDLPLAEVGIPAVSGALVTNQVKKKLKSMNEDERQKNKDEMFKEISQEYKEMYKDKPEFLEKMLLSLHETIYMDKKADGGRIGYKDGPKFDIQASGTKTGKQQITNAPKGFTIDKETFNAILKADIPLSEKIDFLASYQYGKGRDRIEKDNQELFLGEGGFKDRNVGLGFNKDGEGIGGTLMYNMETGKPEFNIGFKKSFEDGGRVGLKGGSLKKFLERRNFLKTIVGNSPEAENARILQKILDEQKQFKKFLDKNPPVKFPGPGDKEYDDYILRLNQIMAKDRLKSAAGGRVGYKLGSFDKGRRAFLKMLGIGAGTTAAAKSGILKFSDAMAPKIIEKVPINSSTSSVPPPYFFELAQKIKTLGKPDKVTYQDRVEIHRYTGKNGDDYELIEDLNTGDMKITKDKTVGVTSGDEMYEGISDRSVMDYKKGQGDEMTKGTPADEYDEYKVEFDADGTEADATELDAIIQKEIIEEAKSDAPTIKKAGGGIARMLGE